MTKLIAEIGINHNGSYKIANKICDFLCKIDAWGIKFQYRNINNYLKQRKSDEIGKEILDEEILKNFLSPKKIISLSKKIRKQGVKVGISFFTSKDVNDFKGFNFDFYKIPSAVCDNFQLIDKIKNKKNIFISLGTKNDQEIMKLRTQYNKILKKKFGVFHCVSNYPLLPINSNLFYLDKLKKIFKNSYIGYSSHDNNLLIPSLALGKKLDFIERHVTFDKNAKGLDHSSSSNFSEIEQLNFLCKNIEKIYFSNQNNRKIVNQGELINLQNLGIGYSSKKFLKKGKRILAKDIEEKYGKSLGSPYTEIINKVLKKDLKKGQLIDSSYFEKKKKLSPISLKKLDKNLISLPIRPKDYKLIDGEFGLKHYEFHLSFNDVKNLKFEKLNKNFLKKKFFSVHAPDYCDENHILDIFSNDLKIKKKSELIINKCVDFCRYLSKITNFNAKLICSFSKINKNENKKIFYAKLSKYILKIKHKKNILILPQWLPTCAWYFGGSNQISVFSDPKDLAILKSLRLYICMDISHFLLSCNFNKIRPDNFFKKYLNLYKHYHISDAIGVDGEGVLLGSGEISKTQILPTIFKRKKNISVIETWQGHLNGYNLFKKDISYLLKNIF